MTLDVETALKRLNGCKEIYLNVLKSFVDEYANAGTSCRQLIADGDLPQMQRYAHTVKGIAGAMGENELYQTSLAMEQAAKDGLAGSDLQAALDTFLLGVEAAIKDIKSYLADN